LILRNAFALGKETLPDSAACAKFDLCRLGQKHFHAAALSKDFSARRGA
jgi:hypothetical protein